jgi:hypothetical protein
MILIASGEVSNLGAGTRIVYADGTDIGSSSQAEISVLNADSIF